MSFSFSAAGHRHDVIASLRNASVYDNQAGAAIRDAIIAGLEQDQAEGKKAWSGGQLVYVVKAFGHSGPGAPLSLSVTVETFDQPAPVHDTGTTTIAEEVAVAAAEGIEVFDDTGDDGITVAID